MQNYWVKTPRWLKQLFPRELTWKMPAGPVPSVYLTFDDGPHPKATAFALEQLDKYNGKATFFCIGKNVVEHPDLYQQLLDKGHAVGNHTYNHKNGWHTDNFTYMSNILKASKVINSHLFRPPYGRIKRSQVRKLYRTHHPWQVVMWDVLSGDFDVNISPEKCLQNVIDNIEPGSIVVFHDSEKAWDRMQYALPKVLAYCREKNWQIASLSKD